MISQGVEKILVVTALCDMHAFEKNEHNKHTLRRAINFIEGRDCFPNYPTIGICNLRDSLIRREAINECEAVINAYVDELNARGAYPEEFDYDEIVVRLWCLR